jgi:hypothetical protein
MGEHTVGRVGTWLHVYLYKSSVIVSTSTNYIITLTGSFLEGLKGRWKREKTRVGKESNVR